MMIKPNAQLLILTFFIFSSSLHAAIYKWVDENGVTQFGNQPPAQKESRQVKENTGNSFKAQRDNSASTSQDRRNSSRPNVESKEQDNTVDCYAAVDNTKASIKSLREVGREKYRHGDLSYDDYKKGVEKLRHASHSVSLADCRKSEGKKRKFYSCMNNGGGEASHAVLCALLLRLK